jgi:hypothetical protein
MASFPLLYPRQYPRQAGWLIGLIAAIALGAYVADAAGAPRAPYFAGQGARQSFGLVHGEGCDSDWLGVAYTKNWWDKQGGAEALRAAADREYACGKMVTPLMVAHWDGLAPGAIRSAMTNYFAQNPDISVWEFGREENLGGGDGCCSPAQLALLEKKLYAVRAARDDANNPSAKIAYQIANLDLRPFEAFLNSRAARWIDVLAAHPYPWPDFPTPESWHDEWIEGVKRLIAASPYANKKTKIMYTEVGAPVSGVDAPGDRAQSPLENAQYLVKLHVMAFNAGVERVYWYHGQDTCGDAGNAECNFGLTAHDGRKRPAYFAYRTLLSCLEGKAAAPAFRALEAGVRVYEFAGERGKCLVAWTYAPGVTQRHAPTLPVVKLPIRTLTDARAAVVRDVTGAITSYVDGLTLSPSPVFIETF